MNLRWLWGNFTDPEFGLSRRQQKEVTRLAHRKYLSKWQLTVWTIGLSVAGILAIGFGATPLTDLLNLLEVRGSHLISLAILCIAVVVFAAWMYRSIYLRPVRLAMRELHYDLCIECGYRLQGLDPSITQCPECGAKREAIATEVKL